MSTVLSVSGTLFEAGKTLADGLGLKRIHPMAFGRNSDLQEVQ